MKISELVEILENIKKHHGDKFIWSQDNLDFPCPNKFSLELVSEINKTSMGYIGGQAREATDVEVFVEYQKNGKIRSWEF